MIAGHPFKTRWQGMSSGYLEHPDMKRFNINTPILFAPPNPDKMVGAVRQESSLPSFADFFQSYFGGSTIQVSNASCGRMMENMKRCYENHADKDPVDTCQYYIQGFERMACGKN